jgi:predicted glycosyltransferase
MALRNPRGVWAGSVPPGHQMKVLIDIGHPAHVHIFKNLAWHLQGEGHSCFFTVRDKDISLKLVEHYGFRHVNLGRHYRSTTGKLLGLARFDLKMLRYVRQEKPDLLLSHGSMYAAHAAGLTGRPHVSLEDTEGSIEQIRLYRPWTRAILTSRGFPLDFGAKHVRYDGYHELAYLHPRVFRTPVSPLPQPGLGRKRVLLRLTAFEASHDAGQRGIASEFTTHLVNALHPQAEVLISSERELPPHLQPRRLRLPPQEMHAVLATVDLYVGDGSTMASECAMLGVPSIYVNSQFPHVVREQSLKYGLIEWITDPQKILDRSKAILNDDLARATFRSRRDRLVADCINVSDFLHWFVTQFPGSLRESQEHNTEVMARFR